MAEGNTRNVEFQVSCGNSTIEQEKLNDSSVYLNLERSNFPGSIQVSIIGWEIGKEPQNCTNRVQSFNVEAGKKYFMYNSVKEKHCTHCCLHFDGPANATVTGFWSPDSKPENGCITLTGREQPSESTTKNSLFDAVFPANGILQTPFRAKSNDSSVYVSFASTEGFEFDVSVIGRKNGQELNKTNRGDCFRLRGGNKYLLYNGVKEGGCPECCLRFKGPQGKRLICTWSPDSIPENGCITVKAPGNLDANTKDHDINIKLNAQGIGRTEVLNKGNSTCIYLNLQKSSFSGTIKLKVLGCGPAQPEQNCTYNAEAFSIESGSKYMVYNYVNEWKHNRTCLEFIGAPNTQIVGVWSPDSIPENGCINLKTSQNVRSVKTCSSNLAAKLVNVPYMNQIGIPTGCESVSAVMVLRHFGIHVEAKTFISKYLLKKPIEYKGNQLYAADPFSAFVGDPFGRGWGCYSPCLADAMNKALSGSGKQAVALFNYSLEQLCKERVSKNKPVIIWATMNMKPTQFGSSSWIINYTDKNSRYHMNETYRWSGGEHCLVLVGYNQNFYFFNDPYMNRGIIGYDKEIVEERYKEQGSQCIVVNEVGESRPPVMYPQKMPTIFPLPAAEAKPEDSTTSNALKAALAFADIFKIDKKLVSEKCEFSFVECGCKVTFKSEISASLSFLKGAVTLKKDSISISAPLFRDLKFALTLGKDPSFKLSTSLPGKIKAKFDKICEIVGNDGSLGHKIGLNFYEFEGIIDHKVTGLDGIATAKVTQTLSVKFEKSGFNFRNFAEALEPVLLVTLVIGGAVAIIGLIIFAPQAVPAIASIFGASAAGAGAGVGVAAGAGVAASSAPALTVITGQAISATAAAAFAGFFISNAPTYFGDCTNEGIAACKSASPQLFPK